MSVKNFVTVMAMIVPLCIGLPAANADWNSDLERAKRWEMSLEKAIKNALAAGESVDIIVVSALAARFDRTRIVAALLSAGVTAEVVTNALVKVGLSRNDASRMVTAVLANLAPIVPGATADYGSTPVTGSGGVGGGGSASAF